MKKSVEIWKQNSEELFNSIYGYVSNDANQMYISNELLKLWYENVFIILDNIKDQIRDPL